MTRSLAAICLFSLYALSVKAQSDEFAITNEPPPITATATNASGEPAECKLERPTHWPISISGELGSTGAGGNASWRFADHLGLRGGGNYFAYSYSGDIEDIRYNSDVRMMSEHVSLDFYPIKEMSFRISVGALFNQNQLTGSPNPNQTIVIDGVPYTPAEYGKLNLKITQEPVSPYVSVSGNFFYFDRGHHWSMGGELGLAYSPWHVSLKHTGGTNPPGLDQAITSQERKIDDQLNRYPVWPILKLYVSGSF
jgi:hypothetical protein